MIPPSPSNNHHHSHKHRPRIHFLNALATIPVHPVLLKGIEVIQVSANGSFQAVILTLSEDKFTLTISSSQKKAGFFRQQSINEERAIDIGEMDRIQRGQSTQQFEKAKKNAPAVRKPLTLRSISTGSSGGAADILTPAHAAAASSSLPKAPLKKSSSVDYSSPSSSGWSNIHETQLDPHRSFSIIFRGAHTVDLMAVSLQVRNEICDTLDRLLLAYQRGKVRVAHDVQLLRYVWLNVDHKKVGYINMTQIAKVLQEINLDMKQRDLQATYEKFGKVIGLDRAQRRRGLTFEQSATFLHKLKRDSWMVKPVTVIWNEIFGEVMNNGKPRLTVSDRTFLERFLHGDQGQMNATMLDVRKLFRRIHDMEIAHTTSAAETSDLNRINKDQFEAYLLTAENEAFDPEKERFNPKDMDQPLSEYWINSSHNTYLIGDQYTSHSSVEMYSNALYRGCRCLELDIWDGSKTNDGTPIPVVWHGHTMTTKIRFVDIIKTIKVFLNFHPDTFPIILSFENHCSIPYQEVMAEMLERILGDSLYVPTEASLYGPLPSPNQLRGMVVIKGRRPDGTEADAYDTDDDSDDEGGPTSSTGLTTEVELEAQRAQREKVTRHGVSPELARLSLFHGHKLKSWEASTRAPTYHMHSFSENKVRSRCRHKEAKSWIIYNQTHMSRTYPAGSRVDSSNYNPLLAWSLGCQMVALNFQTQDAFLRLNDGRFRENGNCGYVLKPTALLLKEDYDEPDDPVPLSIRVLSGSCIPKAKGARTGDCIDPYIKVAVFDVKNGEKETITTFPTSVAPANGFFPIWSQEKFSFLVENWSVAMLQLTVLDRNRDDFIASSSIPLSCLRRGIRSVKLYDATNTRSGAFDFASLLLHINIGQVIAEI